MEDTEQGDIDYWITPKVDCIGKNMVVFIKSRMESFGIRQIIRNTWVSVATVRFYGTVLPVPHSLFATVESVYRNRF